MSNEYIELEVSERTAKFTKTVMIIAVILGAICILLSILIGMGGDVDTATTLAIAGFLILVAGFFIYYIAAILSNISQTMSGNDQMKYGLITIGLIVGSLAATFILVLILTA